MRQSDLKYLHQIAAGRISPDRRRLRGIRELLLVDVANDDADAAVALAWLQRLLGESSSRAERALFQRAAEHDHPTALLELANIRLEKGEYGPAIKLFRRAAQRGYGPAMVRLAQLHLEGLGVPKSSRRAEQLLREAWRRREISAALWLGLKRTFYDGRRWPEAAHWYALAARAGNVHAMVNYAVCLERGLGVRRRLDRAMRWFEKAAKLGDADAKRALRRLRGGKPLPPLRD